MPISTDQISTEVPKKGPTRREAVISVASDAEPETNTSNKSSQLRVKTTPTQ